MRLLDIESDKKYTQGWPKDHPTNMSMKQWADMVKEAKRLKDEAARTGKPIIFNSSSNSILNYLPPSNYDFNIQVRQPDGSLKKLAVI